ncbi:carnitine O-palmitoyltransferase 2, mitochondrial-like [Watersipora subatra]|uniref:carnitine O-palmitoyltransferase 2, mitochondrial-like n=1 Tax=Watersipora subatra TaxID=2589382 RepID=UPI00355C2646
MLTRCVSVGELLKLRVQLLHRIGGGRYRSDYLQRSVIPTDHFQQSLPRLPIPKLEDTCSRYLESQKALLSPDVFAQTKNRVDEFQSGVGKDLQEILVKFDKENSHTSYITGFWFDMYLKDRRPVLLTHNPFLAFKPLERPELNEQLVRSTNLVMSSLRYCKTLRANLLEPSIYHINKAKSDTPFFRRIASWFPKSISYYWAYFWNAYPLDMSQFPGLFNSTRIPREGKDELFKDESAKHLLVIRNGNMYTFDCFDADGNVLPAAQIMTNLKHILNDASEKPSHSLGWLTAQNRDVWANARQRLLDNGNESQLKMVDSALFALCLDSTHSEDFSDLAKQFLCNDSFNRWHDKSFSVIVTSEGSASVTFEHSWGDGVAVLSYFEAVQKSCANEPDVTDSDAVGNCSPAVSKIDFTLNDANKADIDAAKAQTDAATGKLLLTPFECTSFSGRHLRSTDLKADAMMQFMLQLAFKRAYSETPSTYESASTSAFKHGRTETVRPATVATNRACELMDKSATKEEIMAALLECSNTHGALTKNAVTGQGWDRHLYALRHFAENDGQNISLFSDPAYKEINTITLSTSTLNSPSVLMGAFAPVVPHGLGVGYSAGSDQFGAVVTAYTPHKKPEDFVDALSTAVDDVKRVVL